MLLITSKQYIVCHVMRMLMKSCSFSQKSVHGFVRQTFPFWLQDAFFLVDNLQIENGVSKLN